MYITYEYLKTVIYNTVADNFMLNWYMNKLDHYNLIADPELRQAKFRILWNAISQTQETEDLGSPFTILKDTFIATAEDVGEYVADVGSGFKTATEFFTKPYVLIPLLLFGGYLLLTSKGLLKARL